MKARIVWGIAWVAAGMLILADRLPGDVATGPRIGIGMALLTVGLLMIGIAIMPLFLRKTTKAEDYQGTCPVGESCPACGAFNYKPRRDCRSCGGPVNAPEQA